MKKILTLFFALTSVLFAYGQEMPSVAGLTYGMTRSECERILDKRFGSHSYIYSNKKNLVYENVEFAGEEFVFANFIFSPSKEGGRLMGGGFCSKEMTLKEAEAMRDRLLKVYLEKYKLVEEDVNDDGYKYYELKYPSTEIDLLIEISIEKDDTNQPYVIVTYGAVSYANPANNI